MEGLSARAVSDKLGVKPGALGKSTEPFLNSANKPNENFALGWALQFSLGQLSTNSLTLPACTFNIKPLAYFSLKLFGISHRSMGISKNRVP